jgi:hypothetical protein
MVAQVGARRLVGALAGDDAGGFAASVLGLLAQVEQSQSRLISLEQQMKVLLDQRYTVSLQNGTRLLKQSAMSGRASQAREGDLDAAAASLMDAAHAATTPIQAAVAERQLFLTQLKRGDLELAREAWRNLDLHVGDAVTRNYARYEHPADECRRRIADGEFGQLTWLERFETPDPRWHRAWAAVQRDARTAASELAALLADAVSGAALVDVGTGLGGSPPLFPRGLSLVSRAVANAPVVPTPSSMVAIDVPLGRKVVVGGVEATLHGVSSTSTRPQDDSGYLHDEFSAEVTVAAGRRERCETWLTAGSADLSDAPVRGMFVETRELQPGTTAAVTGRHYRPPEYPPRRLTVAVGGLALSALLPDVGVVP